MRPAPPPMMGVTVATKLINLLTMANAGAGYRIKQEEADMNTRAQRNGPCWKLICRDIGLAAVACTMWTTTFSLIFAGY